MKSYDPLRDLQAVHRRLQRAYPQNRRLPGSVIYDPEQGIVEGELPPPLVDPQEIRKIENDLHQAYEDQDWDRYQRVLVEYERCWRRGFAQLRKKGTSQKSRSLVADKAETQ